MKDTQQVDGYGKQIKNIEQNAIRKIINNTNLKDFILKVLQKYKINF